MTEHEVGAIMGEYPVVRYFAEEPGFRGPQIPPANRAIAFSKQYDQSEEKKEENYCFILIWFDKDGRVVTKEWGVWSR
jgi:hypothetical protein